MIQLFINEIDFTDKIEIDLSFVEKLNRELDEGYISIPHTNLSRPFSMFDVVDIYWDQQLIFSGRISMDRVSVASFNDNLYNHEISLVEHTKVLEKYIVKGKTFTRPIDTNYGTGYTLLEVLQILRNTTPLEIVSLKSSYRPFNIPQETINLTTNIIAPEFNFKDLTLRQALDQVASVLDSIVRLDRNGDLFFTQFDKLKDKIDFVANNYLITQNTNNYSTTIESEMLNSVMGANDIVNDELEEVYPSKTGFTTLRSDGYLFGFQDDVHIPTRRPIYRVNDLITVVEVTVNKTLPTQPQENVINDIREISIADRVLPFETWNTLEVDGGLEGNDPTPIEFKPDNFFKNNTVYYRYGKNNIFVGEVFGVFGVDSVLPALIFASTMARLREQGILPAEMDTSPYIDSNGTEWELLNALIPNSITQVESKGKFLSRVFYTSIPRALRFQVERDTIEEVNFYSESIVNQQTRLIDINKYGNNLKGRINQMGNSIKQLSHRVDSPLSTFDIGDFVLDEGLYVITQKEVIIHRNHTVVNYELTRNFNNFSQFMGVDKEIRQSEVGESNRTVERDLIYKEFIEIETSKNTNQLGSNNSLTIFDKESVIRTFDKNRIHEGIDFAAFTNEEFNDWFVVSLNKISGGNTVGFNFEVENNISVGNQLRQESRIILPDRSFNEPVQYADSQGRFENLSVRMYKESLYPNAINDTNSYDSATAFADKLPFVLDEDLPNTTPMIQGEWYVEKDNREIIKFSLLYPILSKNIEKVIIGNRFSLLNGLVRDGSNNVQLWLYENRRFDTSDSNKSLEAPDIVYDENLQLFFSIDNNRVIIQNTIPTGYSWALVDDEGFPYLMSNTNDNVIIFNFENKRSNVFYLGLKPVFFNLTSNSVGQSTQDFTKIEPILALTSAVGGSTFEFTTIFSKTVPLDFVSNAVGSSDTNIKIIFIQLESQSVSSSSMNITSYQPIQFISNAVSNSQLNYFAEVSFSNDGEFGTITTSNGTSSTLIAAPGGEVTLSIGNIFGTGTLRISINGGLFNIVNDGANIVVGTNQTVQFRASSASSWIALVALTDNNTNNIVGQLGINIPLVGQL